LAQALRASVGSRAKQLSTASVFKAVSPDGNPELSTVLRVLRVLACACTPRLMHDRHSAIQQGNKS
jgi:DNA-binding phage protein